ncbi:MAG TPA: oxidative damage protection protein [Methylococcaceae bacterium]|nr:oxidative damage protection protein [Methylococcaceae bacterium]
MTRLIHCVKLNCESEGLDAPPFPGAKGERIYREISRDAWDSWLRQQTMLINEYRLTPFEAKSRAFLEMEREKFLFGGSGEAASD